jgi:dipeptidase
MEVIQGSYERGISLYRTSYSFVAEPKKGIPDEVGLFWFSQYAPSSASYAPILLGSRDVPKTYRRGTLYKYDSDIAFWNFLAAGNYAGRFYRYAIQDIKALQKRLMSESTAAVQKTIESVRKLASNRAGTAANAIIKELVTDFATDTTNEQAEKVVSSWRDLLPQLITT